MLGLFDIPLTVVIVFLIIDLFFYKRIRDFFIDWAHMPDNIVATLLAHAFAVVVFGVLYGLLVHFVYR